MASTAFTPQLHRHAIPPHQFPSSSFRRSLKPTRLSPSPSSPWPIQSSLSLQPSFSDPFVLQLAETLEDSLPSPSSPSLQTLRDSSSEALLSTPWPSRRDEPFRYTDTSFIQRSLIHPVSRPSEPSAIKAETEFPNLTIVDGFLINSLSNPSDLSDGVFVGSFSELAAANSTVADRVGEVLRRQSEKDLFWSINGVGSPEVGVVYVAAGCQVAGRVGLRYFASESGEAGTERMPVSNPRVVVVIEAGSEVEIVEEFWGSEVDKCYWANAVLDVVIGERAKLRHCYVQRQSFGAAHIKWTSVKQESASTYELIEVSTGGKLSRHNLHIKQLGPDTKTELSTLHVSVTEQTQDLHSSLVLDHPRGYSRQLHKCIISHSLGQGVFDGNVKVNRYAQQTDACQLTRSLLLEPRASVNVKPNLQIIADDVKCSHGAAICDLEESQLFYFQARGIDPETARKALVFSFGAEVFQRIPHPSLRKEVEDHFKNLLDPTKRESSTGNVAL